jgi:hypothetical protein
VQQVADIKRTNSLLSDSAMFARDTLLIPTRPLPMGCVLRVAQHAGCNKQMRAGPVPNILLHAIELLPIRRRNEYSAWAGLIVTQYGQVSRNLQDRPTLGYTGSGAPDNPSQTAIAQLRAHYGLSPATSPTATAGLSAAAPSQIVSASCSRHFIHGTTAATELSQLMVSVTLCGHGRARLCHVRGRLQQRAAWRGGDAGPPQRRRR